VTPAPTAASVMARSGDSSSSHSTAIASNNLPDFAYVNDKTYQLLLDSGLVADCTEAWDLYICDEYKALLDESSMGQMTFDGKLMGFPMPNKGYHGPRMLFVRQDWLLIFRNHPVISSSIQR